MTSISIDQTINNLFEPFATFLSDIIFYSVPLGAGDDALSVKLILVLLAGAALFFTIYLNFINLRGFKHAIDQIRGKCDHESDAGEISKFQALSASLSGAVGLGNIAGVAVAISLGGPGAVFWMVMMGLLGMSSKFAEVMLGVKYRIQNDPEHPETFSGGPMYYLKAAFAKIGLAPLGIFFAGFFAICGIGGAFGGGNMFQANQSYQQLVNVTMDENGISFWSDYGWLFGLILAIAVGIVIIGGLKSIAGAAAKIVPAMGVLYMGTCLFVIIVNWHNIPAAFMEIFTLAFDTQSAFGGILGAMLVGVQRASFSNEAGLGSAAIVQAPTKTDEPASQGFVGMLGPFIDTVIVCTMTALVIVISGVHHGYEGEMGVAMTSSALETGLSFAPYILALVVLLFAYSTMITWAYIGEKCLTYLTGESDLVKIIYRLIFCLFVIIGSSADLGHVINFSDAMIFAMGIPNIIGLLILAPEIRKDLKAYWRNRKSI